MRNLFANDVVALDAGRTVSGIAEQARTLRVISGRVWLTIEGAQDDYWLEAGDAVSLTPNRLIVVEADVIGSRIESARAKPCLRRSTTQIRLWPALHAWVAKRLPGKTLVSDVCSGPRLVHCHDNAR